MDIPEDIPEDIPIGVSRHRKQLARKATLVKLAMEVTMMTKYKAGQVAGHALVILAVLAAGATGALVVYWLSGGWK